MAPFALLFGGLMIALGLVGYLSPETLGGDKQSLTALIPAAIGAILVLAGVVTLIKPTLRKHTMHLAALAGVIGLLGGFEPLIRSKFNFGMASVKSGMIMSGLSLIFVVLCVRSFIAARKARKAA